MLFGTCPKCNNAVMSVNLKEVPISAAGANWVGVSYQCGSCNCVLSVGIDPVALKADIVNEVLEGLGRR